MGAECQAKIQGHWSAHLWSWSTWICRHICCCWWRSPAIQITCQKKVNTQQDEIHRVYKSNYTQTVLLFTGNREMMVWHLSEDEQTGILTGRRRPWLDSLSWCRTLPGNRAWVHSACPPSTSEHVNTSEAPQQGRTTAQQPSAGSLRTNGIRVVFMLKGDVTEVIFWFQRKLFWCRFK